MNILIAEDDSVTCLLLRSALAKMRRDVTEAANELAALAAWEELRHPLTISDWLMPDLDVLAAAVERCLTEESLRETRETAGRANATKSEFLSRASHELRTPMNHVLGFAQLLETDSLTLERKENVQQILTSGAHLLTLIDRILQVSQSEPND